MGLWHHAGMNFSLLLRAARVLCLLVLSALSSLTWAQTAAPHGNYPDRPVKIIVPFAPGAGTDAMGRLVAQKLGEVMNATFVVDNRAGASGAIGKIGRASCRERVFRRV